MAPLLGDWAVTEPNQPSSSYGITSTRKNILYVDAYDSFSYNVVAMLEETLDARVTVMTIDSEWPDGNMAEFLQHYEAIVLGPGPGNPNIPKDVGIMKDIWSLNEADLLPVLGICLGFQSLCLHHGMSIERLPYPLHGQVRQISSSGKDIFVNMPTVEVTLYHSLYAKLNESIHIRPGDEKYHELEFLAWLSLEDETSSARMRIPMAVRHARKPFWGFQFHPESCKSDREACNELLRRWWEATLSFNKKTGRCVYGCLPDNMITSSDHVHTLSDVAYTMLSWSASTSAISTYRSLSAGNLTAEMICEALNTPGSPTVLFQSNGRYSVISVPSPGSWRLEYYAQFEKLLLEQLRDDCHTSGAAEQRCNKGTSIETSVTVSQFWDALRYLMEMKKVKSGNPVSPFWGGFLGYFSYEMGLAGLARPKTAMEILGHNESFKQRAHPQIKVPIEDPADVSLLWVERSIVVDNKMRQIIIQSTRESDTLSGGWLDLTLNSLTELSNEMALVTDGDQQSADTEFLDTILKKSIIEFPDEQTYKEQVGACKVELEAGESYELCLTCETPVVLQSPDTEFGRLSFPWKLYKRLRKYNPATFSAYARLGNVKIISSSPECFLNWDRDSMLEMKPMKGTVKKTSDMTLEKAKEILGSTKEMAENLMIADLIRHDLYGICGSGRVHVEKLLEVEDHGRVYQMITHVKGEVDHLRPGVAVRHVPQLKTSNMSVYGVTALQRCLPPGSMTGAPKERSCMHLSSIEDRKRGIYSGVMGYLDLGGGGSFSVLIRTAFSCTGDDKDEQLWRVGAGGAVTTLSTAEGEWDEMLTKLQTVCNIFNPLGFDKSSTAKS